MALPNTTVLEVRGAIGDDTNGGGFVAGGAGTDWSTAAGTPQYSVTDAVTAGTTTITSASANFGTDVVDNILYIAGGTGAIAAQRYRIVSRTNVTTIVVDRATGLTAGTGATLKIGGAFATIQGALNAYAPAVGGNSDMTTWVKADGTHTIASSLTTPAYTPQFYRNRVMGYSTTRGDGGRVTIATSGAITALVIASAGWTFNGFILSGGGSGLIGVSLTGAYNRLDNMTISGFTTDGVRAAGGYLVCTNTEIMACSGSAAINAAVGSLAMSGCYVHDNTTVGILAGVNQTNYDLDSCIVANNTGVASDGINMNSSYGLRLTRSLVYGNGRDGLRGTAVGFTVGDYVVNCLFAKNGGYGVDMAGSLPPNAAYPWIDYNGYWSNTLGPRNNVVAGAHEVNISGTDPTNDPFLDKALEDWRLNTVSGAGALLRGAGYPGAIAGLPGVLGYADIGPYQHQDPAGGGGLLVHPGMTGRMHG